MTIVLSADCQSLINRQGGVLSCSQAADNEVDPDRLKSRLRYGDWQRLQRGVYASHTGTPSRAAELWAALLRCGEDAVLSHYTAAERHGLLKGKSQSIHVAVPARLDPARYGKIPGLVIHRSDAIVGTCHPAMTPRCTRVEDTVLDILKITRGFDAKYAWVCKAIGGRRTTADRILATLAERTRYPGRRDVQLILGFASEGIMSWLELQWVNGVERPHGLPAARRQVRVAQETGSKYLDNLYEDYRLCVELDGRAAHPESEQGRDKDRDRWNLVHGKIVTMRFETRHMRDAEHQCLAAAEVARYLSGHRMLHQGEPIGRPCSPICPVGRFIC
jgi:hypothetical protein